MAEAKKYSRQQRLIDIRPRKIAKHAIQQLVIALDRDGDDRFTVEDMLQYDARHKVLGSAQLIHEMFHEADGRYTGKGLCGAEDVTSAVAFRLARSKTPYDHSAQKLALAQLSGKDLQRWRYACRPYRDSWVKLIEHVMSRGNPGPVFAPPPRRLHTATPTAGFQASATGTGREATEAKDDVPAGFSNRGLMSGFVSVKSMSPTSALAKGRTSSWARAHSSGRVNVTRRRADAAITKRHVQSATLRSVEQQRSLSEAGWVHHSGRPSDTPTPEGDASLSLATVSVTIGPDGTPVDSLTDRHGVKLSRHESLLNAALGVAQRPGSSTSMPAASATSPTPGTHTADRSRRHLTGAGPAGGLGRTSPTNSVDRVAGSPSPRFGGELGARQSTSPRARFFPDVAGDDDLEGDDFVAGEAGHGDPLVRFIRPRQSTAYSSVHTYADSEAGYRSAVAGSPVVTFAAAAEFDRLEADMKLASDEAGRYSRAHRQHGEHKTSPVTLSSSYSLAATRAKARHDRRKRNNKAMPAFQSHFGPAHKCKDKFHFDATQRHTRIDLRPVRRTVTGEKFIDPSMSAAKLSKQAAAAAAAAVSGGTTDMPTAQRLPICSESKQDYAHAPDYQGVSRCLATHIGRDPSLSVAVEPGDVSAKLSVVRVGTVQALKEGILARAGSTARVLNASPADMPRAQTAGPTVRDLDASMRSSHLLQAYDHRSPTQGVGSPTPSQFLSLDAFSFGSPSPTAMHGGGGGSTVFPMPSPLRSSVTGPRAAQSGSLLTAEGVAGAAPRPASPGVAIPTPLASPARRSVLQSASSVLGQHGRTANGSGVFASGSELRRSVTAFASVGDRSAGLPRPSPSVESAGAHTAAPEGATLQVEGVLHEPAVMGRTLSSLASQSVIPRDKKPFERLVRGATTHQLRTEETWTRRAVQGEYKQWQPIKYRKDFIPRRRTHAAILTDKAIRRGEAELHQAQEQLEESKVISPAPNGKRARNLHIHTGEKPKHAPAPSPLLSQHQGFNLLARLSGNASSSRHRLRVKQGGVSKLRESAQELDPRLKSLTYLPEDNTPAGAPKPKPFVTRFKSPAAHQELATGKPFAKLQKDPINYRPLLD